MVISHIIGGLGNQMFQYAIGRVIAEEQQETLFLDIEEFDQYDLRNFELEVFNLIYKIARYCQLP